MTEWILLAVALALVLACGMFVAAEFALVTVDRPSVERAAAAGDSRAEGTLAALRTLSTQLSGAQVGITVTNLAIGFLAEPAIAQLVDGPLEAAGLSPSWVSPVAITIGLVLATVMTMVFGELVPKNLAVARPLPTAGATQWFQRGFTTGMAWPIRWLNGAANGIVRAFGVEPQEELRSARNPEELASLVNRSAQQGMLDPATARLVERSLAFGSRTSADIMTPRVRMRSVDAEATAADVVALTMSTGHSRFPVVDGGPDEVIGAIHIKHAVAVPLDDRADTPVRAIVQPATTVPESLELDPLLAMLRGQGLQMAIVVDEYGGTVGVVTLEDVVEEIVGEIADEHDRIGADIRQGKDGSWSLSGLLRPDEVASRTGVTLPEDRDYDTLAGLVLDRLGRLPEPGDSVEIPLLTDVSLHPDDDDSTPEQQVATLTATRLDGRRIDRIRLAVHPVHPRGDDE